MTECNTTSFLAMPYLEYSPVNASVQLGETEQRAPQRRVPHPVQVGRAAAHAAEPLSAGTASDYS